MSVLVVAPWVPQRPGGRSGSSDLCQHPRHFRRGVHRLNLGLIDFASQ